MIEKSYKLDARQIDKFLEANDVVRAYLMHAVNSGINNKFYHRCSVCGYDDRRPGESYFLYKVRDQVGLISSICLCAKCSEFFADRVFARVQRIKAAKVTIERLIYET